MRRACIWRAGGALAPHFKSVRTYGSRHDGSEDGYYTTEFRKYKRDSKIYYYVNGKHDSWTSATPDEVTDKLAELKTYDVVLQKIEGGHRLIEMRKYKEGQYGKKSTIKSEFMRWNSEHPTDLDNILTKDAVEQELALVPFHLEQQKIEAERKQQLHRKFREDRARNAAELEERRQLDEQRDADIQKMVEWYRQFPDIEAYLRKTINEEAVMKENETISKLQAKVSDLEEQVKLSHRQISTLTSTNTHLVEENKRLLRENEVLKNNRWSLPGFSKKSHEVPVEHLLMHLKQSSDASISVS